MVYITGHLPNIDTRSNQATFPIIPFNSLSTLFERKISWWDVKSPLGKFTPIWEMGNVGRIVLKRSSKNLINEGLELDH